MTGNEFYSAVIKQSKYKKTIEDNLHFHGQMDYIKEKDKVTYATLLNSIAFLSKQLLELELLMIRNGDNGGAIYEPFRD